MHHTDSTHHSGVTETSVAATAATHAGRAVLACCALAGSVYAASVFAPPADQNNNSQPAGNAPLFANKETHTARLPLKRRLEHKSEQTQSTPSQPERKHKKSSTPHTNTVTITPLDHTVIHAGPALSASSSTSLVRAPVARVHVNGRFGIVPIIAPDGSRPADVYARPRSANSDGTRPTIAITVGGLGLNRQVTQKAIDSLPPSVTLSFVPYARGLQSWIDKARAAGHETLLEIPMEPYDYPNNDSGPHTLLTGADKTENIRRLEFLLSRAAGYFGLTNYLGAKFATHKIAVAPVLDEIARRGLVFFHDGTAPRSVIPDMAQRAGLDLDIADRIIDQKPDPDAIGQRLLEIEALSLRDGHALGTGFAFPITIDMLEKWTKGLQKKGFDLIPASAGVGFSAHHGAPS